MKLKPEELKEFLDEKYQLYNNPKFIESDPILVPHRFTKKEDIEIAAFFAATLAWGQRPTIIRNAIKIMETMDNAPYDYILNSNKKDWKVFSTFVHRTFNGVDAAYFMQSLQHIYKEKGGFEKAFYHAKDMREGLIQFRKVFLGKHPAGRTAKHISDVSKNASAKRLNMFLRWMVRNDKRGVDFGIWKSISPSILYCPF